MSEKKNSLEPKPGYKTAAERSWFVDYQEEERVWNPAKEEWGAWGRLPAWIRMPFCGAEAAASAIETATRYYQFRKSGGGSELRQSRPSGPIRIQREDILDRPITDREVEAARSRLAAYEKAAAYNAENPDEAPINIRECEFGSRYEDIHSSIKVNEEGIAEMNNPGIGDLLDDDKTTLGFERSMGSVWFESYYASPTSTPLEVN